MKDDLPTGNEPWMVALRIVFGVCGAYILWKFPSQIASGVLEWSSGEGGDPSLSYLYRATTPAALVAGAIATGGVALGFLAFAFHPQLAFRVRWIVPWAVVCVGALMALKQLSEFAGIVSSP